MTDNLTVGERGDLLQALLSAFRSRAEFQQLLFFRLGVNMNDVADGANNVELVTNLIDWVDRHDKTREFVDGAHEQNSGNRALLKFWQDYHQRRDNPTSGSVSRQPAFTAERRARLIAVLQRLPSLADADGRTNLLYGIPNRQGLNRKPNNMILDLELIVDQLDQLGQLASGEWPLLILIDNAGAAVSGYEITAELNRLRQELAAAYGG